MDQVIATAQNIQAGTPFVVGNNNYYHDGNQVYQAVNGQWAPYNPLPTAPPVPQAPQVNAIPAQGAPTQQNLPGMEQKKRTRSFKTMFNAVVMGHLGADAVFRTAPSGVLCCNFNVATEGYVNGEQYTEWIRVVVFGKSAETQRGKLTKGSKVLLTITKPPRTKSFVGDDGQTKYFTQYVADEVRWVGLKDAADNAYDNGQPQQSVPQQFVQQGGMMDNSGF